MAKTTQQVVAWVALGALGSLSLAAASPAAPPTPSTASAPSTTPSPTPAAPAPAAAPAPKKCVPETDPAFCERLGASCGHKRGFDNCGGDRTVPNCGTCPAGEACGVAGKANACGCAPESNAAFCKRLGAACGSVSASDNCGATRVVPDCGPCNGTGVTCGGGGKANACGCSPAGEAELCAKAAATCGAKSVVDNCGATRNIASCGACTGTGESCGGSGKGNVCGCTAESNGAFCKRLGATCGSVTGADNCGAARTVGECGACTGTGVTCGGANKPNVCGCTPESDGAICTRLGVQCGGVKATDNCGGARTVSDCGACAGMGESCGGAGKPGVCGCSPESNEAYCKRLGASCGGVSAPDNCGRARAVESCGACTGIGQSCGGAGKVNVCGCTPESDAAICTRLGAQCGTVKVTDNCGAARTVADCGLCSGTGATCGGGGTANQCGCTPEPDAAFCTRQGAVCGTKSGVDNCGVTRPSATCGSCGAGFFCQGDNTCFTSELAATTARLQGSGLSTCGAGESCARSLLVTGATIARGTQRGVTATVADVRLDKYEVTVGRFRKFVEAWNKGWRPAAGSGKHTHLNGGRGLADLLGGSEVGWTEAQSRYVGAPGVSAAVPAATGASTANDWNKTLACSSQATWTLAVGAGDERAQNCLSWFDAAAFCIWDGGFLPSEGEWELAATGGASRRTFPWGDDAPEGTRANYNGSAVSAVGRYSAGDGFFGQSDLAGNVWEWTIDGFGPLDASSRNAAKLSGSNDRMLRGGAFVNDAGFLASTVRVSSYAAVRSDTSGVRCARIP